MESLPTRISDIPRHWAARAPHALALHDGTRHWTYAQLVAAADAAAHLLRAHGVRASDRVMVVGENCAAQVALMFGAASIDAWIVPVNARLAACEIDAIRAHSGARCVAYALTAAPEAGAHGARHGAAEYHSPLFGAVMIGALNHACHPEPVAASAIEPVAALMYTSGTTGQPKGVMLTHRNLLFIATVSSALRGLTPDDRAYGVLPISHVFGFASVMLGTLYAGACLYLAPRFSPQALLKALVDNRLTVLQGVPAMYARLLETQDPCGAPLASHLRFAYAGGSPLVPSLKRAVERLLGLPLHNGYGMTESGPTISQTRLEAPRADTSVGLTIPGVEARIVDRHGATSAAGATGELWVRGPNVMQGYYRDPALTAAVMRPDGWLNTGDLARQDADGALFIVGRTKELILRSGFSVYPLEIETVLNAHPGVTQSAVVGRTLLDGNEEVVAFVELDPRQPVSAQQLQAHVAQALASYKCPSEIILMPALPAGITGKILKNQLRTLAQSN